MPHAERIELQDPSGSVMADLQAALATLGPKWGLKQLLDIEPEQARDDVARLSAAALSIVAQAARGADQPPVPEIAGQPGRERRRSVSDPLAWRGRRSQAHQGCRHLLGLRCRARDEPIDLHRPGDGVHRRGLRSRHVVRSRCPLGAAARRCAHTRAEDARRGGRDGRCRRRTCTPCSIATSGSWASATASTAPRIRAHGCFAARRSSSARRGSRSRRRSRVAALEALREKSPDRVLETNVEFWAAVVLDVAQIPPDMYPAMFGCARVAGWSAHIVEQRRTGRVIRPSARYVGPAAHSLAEA